MKAVPESEPGLNGVKTALVFEVREVLIPNRSRRILLNVLGRRFRE
jgi:hypothetical protein